MKSKLFMLCTIVCAMFLICCEEEEPATSRKVETGKVSEITLTSAMFHGVVNVDISQYNDVTFGVMLSNSKAELNERGGEMFKAKALLGKDFKVEIGNLKPEMKYYYCAWLFLNSTQYEFGEIKEFETLAPTLATITTNPITEIMTKSAVVGGCVKDDGGASVTERGVVYSLSKEPTTSNYKVKSGSGIGEFTCNLTNLQDNALYYVRAYAINSKGTVYGEERYFTTKEITLPLVYTSNITDISYTSASISGGVTNDGNAEVTERGIVYSKTQNPTTLDDKMRKGSGTGSFTCNLIDLEDGVTYYVRAYATNLKGTAYSEEKLFTTKTINLPTVSTLNTSNISGTSATIGGNVSADGGANVTERGVVYSTSKDPTTSNNKVKNGSGTGNFSCNLSNLQDGVTYYVRAYATNQKGTAYGEEKSFTTTQISLPTISTSSISNITTNSAITGGNVTNDGRATVTERGVVYSTSANPTLSNAKIKNGSGIGSFTCHLNNLQDGTIYYVRAYAINTKGVAYGNEQIFTTTKITLPIVQTYSATNISYTSATIGGGVTDDGHSTIIERGVVYSTSHNPTVTNNKMTSGTGTGDFTCNLNNLQDGRIYYARAYAINSIGIAYGEEQTFTTLPITLPVVETSSVSNVSFMCASVAGKIANNGGSNVTECGIVYSTSKTPTISNNKVQGWGAEAFSCNLTDLKDGTTFYVRAYAINIKGVAYGEELCFSTLKIPAKIVDLGLSVKWASCNIGAESPEDYGDYFAWGETMPKNTYTWETYKWSNVLWLLKYNNDDTDGRVDNRYVLDLSDDAAHVNWGNNWRMPTYEECKELVEKCTWISTTQNGISGKKVVGPNGNSIFLPSAGGIWYDGLEGSGTTGIYWSSRVGSRYGGSCSAAYCIHFISNSNYFECSNDNRGAGNSVRAVCP
ncbi:MAG: hypothetical protein II267_01280 [Paludibacteraceae bacterium]|nr:hypothetical protein [Paludibacteraceae bacterium]